MNATNSGCLVMNAKKVFVFLPRLKPKTSGKIVLYLGYFGIQWPHSTHSKSTFHVTFISLKIVIFKKMSEKS